MIRALCIAALLGGFACVVHETVPVPPPEAPAPRVAFYEQLSPYGDWIVVERFGSVWRPRATIVGVEFVPYETGGRWIYTDDGWEFSAPWRFASVVFHYGRWMYVEHEGWVWVPGSDWAPAWVEWRYGGGYVGWSPLPPPGVVVVWPRWHAHWCFVETHHFARGEHEHYRLPPERVEVAYHAATPVPAPDRFQVSNEAKFEIVPTPGVPRPRLQAKADEVGPTAGRPKEAPPPTPVTPERSLPTRPGEPSKQPMAPQKPAPVPPAAPPPKVAPMPPAAPPKLAPPPPQAPARKKNPPPPPATMEPQKLPPRPGMVPRPP